MILPIKINVIEKSFFLLLVIAFLRPILTALSGKVPLPIHLIIPLVISYGLLFLLLLSYNDIKWNLSSLLIILFSCYVITSLMWGSDLRNVIELIIALSFYFFGRTFVRDQKSGQLLITVMIIGNILPITTSAVMMFFDVSKSYVQYGMSMERKLGIFGGIHTAAHTMIFFSYIYALFLTFKSNTNSVLSYIANSIFILTIYTVWNTYVRSAFFGMLSFWMFYLFFFKKRNFVIVLIILIGLGTWKLSTVDSIFWQADARGRERNLETASSGRTEIWKHQIKLFAKMPFYLQIMGNGLGSESKSSKTRIADDKIWASHNDFLSLLMTLGVAGLLLYCTVIISVIWEILFLSNQRHAKITYLAIIISFMSTAMITNAGINRFEIHHIFWLLLGCSKIFCSSEPKNL